MILCFSPYVRYAELERCSRAVDATIPETTAIETLPRHVCRLLAGQGEPPQEALATNCLPLQVISSNHELRSILSEICKAEGFEVTSGPEHMIPWHSRASTTDRTGSPVLTIWDVPALEPDWQRWLQHRTQLGPVLALIGFGDRATVGQARNSGAAACLDLPVDASDLIHVIGRINRKMLADYSSNSEGRVEPAHVVPPAPVSRARRGRAAISQRTTHPPVWSEGEPPSTISREKPL